MPKLENSASKKINWRYLRAYSCTLATPILTLLLAVTSIIFTSLIDNYNCTLLTAEFIGPPAFKSCHITKDFRILTTEMPSPWHILIILIILIAITTIVSTTEMSKYRNLEKEYEKSKSKITTLDEKLRNETEYHGTTKSEYYQHLKEFIRHSLPLDKLNFNESCRVSIYRQVIDSRDTLHQAYRWAPQPRFSKKGRVKVPSDEGILGILWNCQTTTHACFEHASGKPKHGKAWETYYNQVLPGHGIKKPARRVANMHSHSFIGIRLNVPGSDKPDSVLLIESTEKNKFKDVDPCAILSEEKVKFEQIAYALNILDSQFHPVRGDNNG